MKFSVVIPVYNKADTLALSVESVLRQTFGDYEIVIVDDGSRDGIDAVVSQWAGNEKIRLIRQENAGVSVARNTGIKSAAGEFICFLDADDLYRENHLEVLNNLILKYPAQTYFATSHITCYPDGRETGSGALLRGKEDDFVCHNLFRLLNQNGDGVIHTNSMCVSRKVVLEREIFFEPNERIGEDTDMWFRLALVQPVVISRKETTVYQREFSTATANTFNSMTWIFPRRMKVIEEMDVSAEIKEECDRLIDRYKMACSRDLLRASNRKDALDILRTVRFRTAKYYISVILCVLPLRMSQWLIAHI